MKSGIYLKYILVVLNSDNVKLWYVFGTAKGQVRYLHKNGKWCESTYGEKDTPDTEVHSGHYETREEAIATIKKYTMFKYIFNEEEKQIDI